MANVIKAPEKVNYFGYTLFLAGSIEENKADRWQDQIVESLQKLPITFVNPRRDNWDNSWQQSIDNPHFKEQVEWELDGIDKSHKVLFYFQPGTKSPITLLELGIVAASRISSIKNNVCVCCPDGYWRKGNVEIVCEKFNIPFFEKMEDMIDFIADEYILSLGAN